jgi:hypothetical protein
VNKVLVYTLRSVEVAPKFGPLAKPADAVLLDEWRQLGVKFASSSERLTSRYYDAVRELFDCVAPATDETPILHEGGI